MKRSDFHYDLPQELIAQSPLAQRAASRLLCLDRASGAIQDRLFGDLVDLLRPGDLMVFNDTRVMPARLFGAKDTGGRVEILVERLLDNHRVLAHVRASKSPGIGRQLRLEGDVTATVKGRRDDLFELVFEGDVAVPNLLEQYGHMPLPPYIERADQLQDRERYQTVYAREPGAVAAPTAGLHFDDDLLARIDARGVQRALVTLHVGAGTFQPVRADALEDHHMHAEWLQVSGETAARVRAARADGRRVIAVGTTVVRALETAAQASGEVEAFTGDTDIFIYPGYVFRAIDGLVTNFHLPESTLLMLVCAFAGYENVMAAYRHAVARRYRFFSYGDAMWIA